jgi:hypothetical protein
MQSRPRTCLLITALTLAGVIQGCDFARFMAYLFAPKKTKTIHAEYPHLGDSRLAILVYMPDQIKSDYPRAKSQITRFVVNEFGRVSGEGELDGLEVVDHAKSISFQRSHPQWESLPRTRIARQLQADYLLIVSVVEFSTRQYSDQIHLYQGNLLASANLYEAGKPEESACVWPVRGKHVGSFSHTFPEGTTTGRMDPNDLLVRQRVMQLFAQELAGRFYTRKVDVSDDPQADPS